MSEITVPLTVITKVIANSMMSGFSIGLGVQTNEAALTLLSKISLESSDIPFSTLRAQYLAYAEYMFTKRLTKIPEDYFITDEITYKFEDLIFKADMENWSMKKKSDAIGELAAEIFSE